MYLLFYGPETVANNKKEKITKKTVYKISRSDIAYRWLDWL